MEYQEAPCSNAALVNGNGNGCTSDDGNINHSTSSPQPTTPIMTSTRPHISLRRTPSGRYIWWMDSSSCSGRRRRSEILLQRRIQYLEEERQLLLIKQQQEQSTHGVDAAANQLTQSEQQEPQQQQITIDETTILTTYSEQAAILDIPTPDITSTSESGNHVEEEEGDEQDVGMNSTLYQSCITAQEDDSNNDQPQQLQQRQENVPVIHLSNNNKSTAQQKMYIDFGDQTTMGEMSTQSFIIHMPFSFATKDWGEEAEEFYIQLDQSSCFAKGIVCRLVNNHHVEEGAFGIAQQEKEGVHEVEQEVEEPIDFSLKRGQSKMVNIAWNPVQSGCVREILYLDIVSSKEGGGSWTQSIVIVGEATQLSQHSVVVEDAQQVEYEEGEETMSSTEEEEYLVVGESNNFTECNMISGITEDSLAYSQEGEEVEGGVVGEIMVFQGSNHELDVAIEDDGGHVEEKKFEEECLIMHSQHEASTAQEEDAVFLQKAGDDEGKSDKVNPTLTNECAANTTSLSNAFMEKNHNNLWNGAAMVSLELSEIQEVDDYRDDTPGEDQLLTTDAAAAAVVVSQEMEDLGISANNSTADSSAESLLISSLASNDEESVVGSGQHEGIGTESVAKPQDIVLANTHATEEESKGLAGAPMPPAEEKPRVEKEEDGPLRNENTENITFLAEDTMADEKAIHQQHELEEILAMAGLVASNETLLNTSAPVDTSPSSSQHEFLYSEVHGTKQTMDEFGESQVRNGEMIPSSNEEVGLGKEHKPQEDIVVAGQGDSEQFVSEVMLHQETEESFVTASYTQEDHYESGAYEEEDQGDVDKDNTMEEEPIKDSTGLAEPPLQELGNDPFHSQQTDGNETFNTALDHEPYTTANLCQETQEKVVQEEPHVEEQKNELEQILALESLVADDENTLDTSSSPEKDDDSVIENSSRPSETACSEDNDRIHETDSQEGDEDHVESPAREHTDTQMANATDDDNHSLPGASLSECLAELEEDFASDDNVSPTLNQCLEPKFPLSSASANTQPTPIANSSNAVVSLFKYFAESEDDSNMDSPDSLQQSNERHNRPLAADHARPLTYNDQTPPEANATNAVVTLSQSIAEVEDALANDYNDSPDQASSTAGMSSPSERLILNYPSPAKAIEEDANEESALMKLMEQASADDDDCMDSSPEKSIGRAKFELNELIDTVTELEEVAQMQNEFITSPTNHDFHKQLDKINDQIDSITPAGAKLRSKTTPGSQSSSKSLSKVAPRIDVSWKKATPKQSPSQSESDLVGGRTRVTTGKNSISNSATPKGSKSSMRSTSKSLSNVKPRIDVSWKESPSSTPAPKRSAQLCYGFFKRPANDKSSENGSPSEQPTGKLSSAKESDSVNEKKVSEQRQKQVDSKEPLADRSSEVEKHPNGLTKTSTKSKSKKSAFASASTTKTLTVLSENSFKTPHRKRSEQIASIRDKIRVLAEKSAGDLNQETSACVDSNDSEALSNNSDQSAARSMKKELMIDPVPNTTQSTARKQYFYKSPRSKARRSRLSLPNKLDAVDFNLSSSKVTSKQSNDLKVKLFSPPPSLGPRELKAYEKHQNRLKNRDRPNQSGDVKRKERSGSSPLTAPSPRELKALEKHMKRIKNSPA